MLIPLSRTFRDEDGELQTETFELDPRAVEMDDDLVADAARVGADMAFVADLIGSYEMRQREADLEFRRFIAEMICEELDGDRKISEWKARARVENLPRFRDLKDAVGVLNSTLALLKGFSMSLQVKASMLQVLLQNQPQGTITIDPTVDWKALTRRPLTRLRPDEANVRDAYKKMGGFAAEKVLIGG
ncbi:MAG: hypothetical protein GY871_04190 [Actinomycetales bacterium]|nr:hypothetical protein [Actinomycetales bacterium]